MNLMLKIHWNSILFGIGTLSLFQIKVICFYKHSKISNKSLGIATNKKQLRITISEKSSLQLPVPININLTWNYVAAFLFTKFQQSSKKRTCPREFVLMWIIASLLPGLLQFVMPKCNWQINSLNNIPLKCPLKVNK